ncbi:MAG: hypothetical protein H6765_00180 [Candidatus Peribacteria bacterium]|nr:MAG: hypothetical protein H6765_00180 [Candidatus Peribacteria bacterium]
MRKFAFLFFVFLACTSMQAQNIQDLGDYLQELEIPQSEDGKYYFTHPDLGDFSLDLTQHEIRELSLGRVVQGVELLRYAGVIASIQSYKVVGTWVQIESPCEQVSHKIFTLFPELHKITKVQNGNVSEWKDGEILVTSVPLTEGRLKVDLIGKKVKSSKYYEIVKNLEGTVHFQLKESDRIVFILK